jgi:hypothetical protein
MDGEDFGYQNPAKEETAQQAEGDTSNGRGRLGTRNEQVQNSNLYEMKQNLKSVISSVGPNPQYSKYYLMLSEIRQM